MKSSLFVRVLLFILVLSLITPAFALAGELSVTHTTTLALPYAQLWAAVIGLFTPLVSYVLNSKLWAEAPESVKMVIQALVAAVVSAIYTAIATPNFGFNAATLELVGTTVLINFLAHELGYSKAGINTKLGARV